MFRFLIAAWLGIFTCRAAMLVDQPDLAIRVAEGFQVARLANTNLTQNISAMTLDAKGHVVIAGPGYIKTLIDQNEAKRFASPQSAADSLLFDGDALFFVAPGGIWKYSDTNADGIADGAPEKWRATSGTRSLRVGPDGAYYFLNGSSLFRVSRDGKETSPLADGFRNPRSFDFNSAGDLFTFDSDVEADFFLPWYAPTRIYQIALGQNHGTDRNWTRPDYYPDNVDLLIPVGRGAPAGVTIYRHTQFPEEYRDSLFICDAQFGKIYSCQLQPRGSSYRPRLDLFLESVAGQPFSPRHMAVTADGSLIVATTNSVFRIRHNSERGTSLSQRTKLEEILRAPQPLEAWSRAKWLPTARQLGADSFARAISDLSLSDADRIRAIEIYAELFGALDQDILNSAASAKSAPIRSRIAWALGHQPKDQIYLQRLALDYDPAVRCSALESILAALPKLNIAPLLSILRQNLDNPDKRLRQAASRISARLAEPDWDRLWNSETAHPVQTELSLILAALWRADPPSADELALRAAETISLARGSQRVDALRITAMTLGDWNLEKPALESLAAYTLSRPVSEEISTNLLPAVRKLIPSADPVLDLEATRLLAMLEDDSPETLEKVERLLQGLVSPTTTFHYLIVLSRLRAPWPESLIKVVTDRVANFDSQFSGRDHLENLNWPARLNEITHALQLRDSRLQYP